jgi:SAM-dependent methyltransferase
MLGNGYVTADLGNPNAKVRADITSIPFKDASFDVIICSHVLEHVENDGKALGELFRVLKEGGWALVDVPISSKKTFEDSSIVDPEGRKIAFGQEDHVRACGLDYGNRIAAAGFDVRTVRADAVLSHDLASKHGIQPTSLSTFIAFKKVV